jgi:hypothetical protein
MLNPSRSLSLQLLVTIVALAVVQACALNPVAVAETPEQKFNAVLLTYDALLEPALEVLEDPNVADNVRRSLQAHIAVTGEVYSGAVASYADFRAARAAVAAGGPGTVLATATANLEKWANDLESALGRLDALTNGPR